MLLKQTTICEHGSFKNICSQKQILPRILYSLRTIYKAFLISALYEFLELNFSHYVLDSEMYRNQGIRKFLTSVKLQISSKISGKMILKTL